MRDDNQDILTLLLLQRIAALEATSGKPGPTGAAGPTGPAGAVGPPGPPVLAHFPVSAVRTNNQAALVGLGQNIDGFIVVNLARIMLTAQLNPIENGVYVASVGAWTRAADLAAGDHASGAAFYVQAGSLRGGDTWACFSLAPLDVVGTDPLTFVQINREDRGQSDMFNRACSVTAVDNDAATAATFGKDNRPGAAVELQVNGLGIPNLGNGTKVAVDAYFSGDGGVTARGWNQLTTGDGVFWNGSVAGYQLAATDVLSVVYFSNE